MPHFVVQKSNGHFFYQIFYDVPLVYKDGKPVFFHSDGTEFWPRPEDVVEIPDYVASIPLDILIDIYKGKETKPVTWALLKNIATVKLRKKTNARQTD